MPCAVHIVFLLFNAYFIASVVGVNDVNSKIKIPKCCPVNQVVIMDMQTYSVKCENYKGELSFSNVTVYDRHVHDQPVPKTFPDIFQVTPDKRPDDEDFQMNYFNVALMLAPYLNEEGFLYLHYPNAYKRWTPVNSSVYCVDYELQYDEETNSTKISDNFIFWCGQYASAPKSPNSFYTAALYISSAFLILLLVVYILLPNLRNLAGKVLMAYVGSLLFAFIFLATIQGSLYTENVCIGLTTTIYFFFLASFCWMNVMSYDIWWTFRGYAKARPIHRRGENFKFCMYCVYGWGVPLVMSIAFVVINAADLKHVPGFVKPLVPEQGCFIEEGQKLVYLYAPMLILIICNWIFFLMTAFNIWRLHRGTGVLDSPAAGTPQAHRNQRNRLFIYLKLSVIMGINWLLEVVSSLTPDFSFWYISDAYNLLIGLAIFLIFVCKKKIYKDLKARLCRNQVPQRSLTKSQTSSTTLSTSSQDTPLQVFHHPNGTNAKR